MKNAKIVSVIATMFLMAIASAIPLRADVESDKDMLTTGSWTMRGSNGKNWFYTATFKPDYTVIIENFPGSPGIAMTLHWKINSKGVSIIFPKYQDVLVPPLDPKGTQGMGNKGDTFIATKVGFESPDGVPPMPVIPSVPSVPTAPAGGTSAFGTQSGTAAVSAPGLTSTPVPGTSAGEMAQIQQKAADVIKTYHNSLVFITGKQASGSGFIASSGTGNYLFTTAYVAAEINDAAFKTLDDTVVQGGAASIAVGHDILRMEMPAGGKMLEVMQAVDENAMIGDYVVVLGNAGGSGVINPIIGKIVGIGADRVEVDAPFEDGNRGSPIIHLNSGKVIGVATNVTTRNYDITTNEKMAKPAIRRFGYRIDSVKTWQTVNWRAFYAQAAEMKNIETLTADLSDFFQDLNDNHKVTPDRHKNPIIKNRIDEWLADRSHRLSDADLRMVNSSFLSFLKVACQTDVTAARQRMTYDYFQNKLAEEQRERDEMSKAFEEIIKNLN